MPSRSMMRAPIATTKIPVVIGPRIDAPGPLFVTEPDCEGEAVDELIVPRAGPGIDASTGEVF
jgi:transposase